MVSCERPKVNAPEVTEEVVQAEPKEKEKKNMIMVGKPAPVFKAPAYHNGEFTEVNLEDYKGQWVVLCFYPGDFTFV